MNAQLASRWTSRLVEQKTFGSRTIARPHGDALSLPAES